MFDTKSLVSRQGWAVKECVWGEGGREASAYSTVLAEMQARVLVKRQVSISVYICNKTKGNLLLLCC